MKIMEIIEILDEIGIPNHRRDLKKITNIRWIIANAKKFNYQNKRVDALVDYLKTIAG